MRLFHGFSFGFEPPVFFYVFYGFEPPVSGGFRRFHGFPAIFRGSDTVSVPKFWNLNRTTVLNVTVSVRFKSHGSGSEPEPPVTISWLTA